MATKTLTLVESVQKQIEEAGSALAFIKDLNKGFKSSKIAAAVAGAIYIGDKGWKKKKGETLIKNLEGLDVKSERHAKNYYNAGRVIIESNMTEPQVETIGLGKLQDFGGRLLEDEATGGVKVIQAKIAEYKALRTKKAEEAKAKKEAEKADKAARTNETAELLNQAFDEEDGLTPERVHAHLSVFFGEDWADWEMVMGESIVPGLNKINALVKKEAKAMKAAAKKAEKESASKAS